MVGVVVAVDPGRAKCGVAAVSMEGDVLARAVIAPDSLERTVREWAQKYSVVQLVVGDRTGAKEMVKRLQEAGLADLCGGITVVDEHMSSVEGRTLYWRSNPPRGWRRLVPEGMRTPPEPYDGWVAEVLARRYIEGRKNIPSS